MSDQNNRFDAWAPPTVGGYPTGFWGPWYGSGIIMTTPGAKASVTLNFDSISEAPSSYNVEIRYWEDGKLIIRNEIITGEGSATIQVGGDPNGSASQIYLRMQSVSIGQIVTVDPGTALEFLPTFPKPGDPITYVTGGALDNVYLDDGGSLQKLPASYDDLPPSIENLSPIWGDTAPGNEGLLPPWLGGPANQFKFGPSGLSPLVLDLDGDGVEVSKLGWGAGASTTYFDMDNDGFVERTAWAQGGDGLLVRDMNANGIIDNQSELFGHSASHSNGFAKLATLDSNASGTITSTDTAWSSLRVWVDADMDGKTDAGELKTLSSLGITSINVNATAPTNTSINENKVSHTSSFVMNGQTRTVSDVWFNIDQADSRSTTPVDLDVRTLFLPTMKGFGNLEDLHVAMSRDEDLLDMVADFVTTWDTTKFQDNAALDEEIKDILYRWASVETVDSRFATDSNFQSIDAQKLLFMEKISGGARGYDEFAADPDATFYAEASFDTLLRSLKAHLIVQAGGASLFTDPPVYNIVTGEITAGVISHSAMFALSSEAASSSSAFNYWKQVVSLLLELKPAEDYSTSDVAALNSAIAASDPSMSWAEVVSLVSADSGVYLAAARLYPTEDYHSVHFTGNGYTDNLEGGQNDDWLEGRGGDDFIYGLAGNDLIDGGSGNDGLEGGNGNDTYIVSRGLDVITETSGTDTIKLAAGISLEDVTFTNVGTSDLKIVASAGLDETTILSQRGTNAALKVENLLFADGFALDLSKYTTWLYASATFNGDNNNASGVNLADIILGNSSANTIHGYDLDDVIHGRGGNDTIYGDNGNDRLHGGDGNDTLDGGAGTDTMYGGAGNDLYKLDTASDVVIESANEGIDTVQIGVAYTLTANVEKGLLTGSSGVSLTGNALDNELTGNGGINTLNGGDGADLIYGNGNTDYLWGGNGNDALYGGSGNDVMHGEAANDTLTGGTGNDDYYGEAGLDILIADEGTDRLWGGADADVFKFSATAMDGVDSIKDYNASQNDVINVKDLLFGYDPLTSLITNFVEMTTSGANTIMRIDRDGTGTSYTWAQAAQIDAVTGMTDEQALLNTGKLIAA